MESGKMSFMDATVDEDDPVCHIEEYIEECKHIPEEFIDSWYTKDAYEMYSVCVGKSLTFFIFIVYRFIFTLT